MNHNSVTLKITPPRCGAENISSYSVEFSVSGEDGWQQRTASKADEVTVSDLSLDTEYVFRCRAVTSVGVGPVSEVSGSVKTLPCSPPGKPQVEPNSSEISVSWQRPAELGPDVQILSYIVEYAQTDDGVKDRQWNQTMSRAEKAIVSGLQSETQYVVRVTCDCGAAGRSKESITVNVCTTKREFARLAEYLKHASKSIKSEFPQLYKLCLKEEDIDIEGCRKFTLGKESMRQNRTIMLLGATGSGKSTLINGIINYIVGVEWKDNFRFTLMDKTTEVTVQTQPSGRLQNELLTDHRGRPRGQRQEDHRAAAQKYVFDSVLSIFGKDVAENIRVLVTFADGQRPPVLEAITASGVPCPKAKDGLPVNFKFNNSALFAHNQSSAAESTRGEDEEGGFDQMFWNMGVKSMRRFFVALNVIETKSLSMTQDVLKERQHLEVSVENFHKLDKLHLSKYFGIEQTVQQLINH
ncbi:hypothetical protein F2P81_000058 [Scophthalmus maximus]|uniref:Fibronectin type-III domain-containing protein n=1 Tax=Scophthalmus maximus TaxID=52904 RepID=A0A6A4TM97_SCOMX|nr:hypothetical protein F2P81_000058 [Scophthalmus maximus]